MDKKKILISKIKLLKEHRRIIPMLRRAGLSKEANSQQKEMNELKRK